MYAVSFDNLTIKCRIVTYPKWAKQKCSTYIMHIIFFVVGEFDDSIGTLEKNRQKSGDESGDGRNCH